MAVITNGLVGGKGRTSAAILYQSTEKQMGFKDGSVNVIMAVRPIGASYAHILGSTNTPTENPIRSSYVKIWGEIRGSSRAEGREQWKTTGSITDPTPAEILMKER